MGEDAEAATGGVARGVKQNVDLLQSNTIRSQCIWDADERKVRVRQQAEAISVRTGARRGGEEGEVDAGAIELLEKGLQKLGDGVRAKFGRDDAEAERPTGARQGREHARGDKRPVASAGAFYGRESGFLPSPGELAFGFR